MNKNIFSIQFFLLIIVIVILTIPAVFAQETPAPSLSSLCGDTNDDGVVDIVDALRIAQEYVGMSPTDFNALMADVDQNNLIDIVDALLVAQYYVGLIDTLSCRSSLPVIEDAFEIINFTSRDWYGGVYGSGGGTNFIGEFRVIIPVVDSIQGIWIENRYYTPTITNMTFQDSGPYFLDDHLLLTFDYRWIPDVPELEIEPMDDPPLEDGPYFQGAALILFIVNGEERGFIADTIEELEPIAYP